MPAATADGKGRARQGPGTGDADEMLRAGRDAQVADTRDQRLGLALVEEGRIVVQPGQRIGHFAGDVVTIGQEIAEAGQVRAAAAKSPGIRFGRMWLISDEIGFSNRQSTAPPNSAAPEKNPNAVVRMPGGTIRPPMV